MCDEANGMKLHSKVRWGNLEEVKELLKISGAVNFQVRGLSVQCHVLQQHDAWMCPQDKSTGNFPIHIGCQNGHQEVAKALVAGGCDVNAQNNNGLTALHMSVAYDYYWTSKLLVEAGADPAMVNGEVHLACPPTFFATAHASPPGTMVRWLCAGPPGIEGDRRGL